MKNDDKPGSTLTRRNALKSMASLAGAAAAPAWLVSRSALADDSQYGSTPKSAVQYQDHPKGDHQCSNCMHFIPGASAGAMGHCKVVAGSIAPKGWCLAWAPATK